MRLERGGPNRGLVILSAKPTGRANAHPTSDLSAQCASKRTSAKAYALMSSRPRRGLFVATAQPADLPVGRFVDRGVQSHLQKYFTSPVGQIISTNSRHPTPPEGRIMIVTDAGRDAVDAAAFCARRDRRAGSSGLVSDHRCADERRFSRTAKSCGPDAPTLASSFAEGKSALPGADKLHFR